MTVAADSLRRNGTKDGPGRFARREERDRRRRAASPCATSSTVAVAVVSGRKEGWTDERMDGQADTGKDCHRSPGETVSQVFGGWTRDRPGQPDPVVVHWEKVDFTWQIDTCHGVNKVSNEIGGYSVADVCRADLLFEKKLEKINFNPEIQRLIIWKWLKATALFN